MKREEKGDDERKWRTLLNNRVSQATKLYLSTIWGREFNVYNEKNRLRHKLLDARLRLSEHDVDSKSELISKNLFNLSYFKRAKNIALYYPIKNEVKTEYIFLKAKRSGMRVYFPRIEGSILRFHEVDNPSKFNSGKFGIPEPIENSPTISAEDLDLVIVPGVAFDLFGGRIGYGMGYYDRSIKQIKREKRVALAYSFQVLNSVPVLREDMDIGYVVTDLGIFSCRSGIGGVLDDNVDSSV